MGSVTAVALESPLMEPHFVSDVTDLRTGVVAAVAGAASIAFGRFTTSDAAVRCQEIPITEAVDG